MSRESAARPSPPKPMDGPRPGGLAGLILQGLEADKTRKPHAPLPSIRDLASHFRVSVNTVQRALRALSGHGAAYGLPGKGYFWGKGPAPFPSPPHRKTDGPDRIAEALKEDLRAGAIDPFTRLPAQKDLAERYRVSTRTLRKALLALEADGRPVLGFLVSTWLIPDVHGILALLRPYRLPISVWWEHSTGSLSKTRFPRNVVFFNLSFGERPGALIAETLLGLGHEHVLFLSPFHASAWSQQRLDGLRNRILKAPGGRITAVTDDSHASPWSFQEEAWKELRARNGALAADDPKVMRRKSRILSRRVRGMLAKTPPAPEATAWVCVNDEVAEIVSAYIRTRDKETRDKRPAPYLISFDNSTASYRLGIDSFAFDSGAMARKMLFHLTRPSAAGFPGRGLIELEGRVERK